MKQKELPNILWICTDQQRFDTIHALGNPHINTPNIDRLVGNGVSFSNAYCQNPVCSPSRASFLTGRYPRTTRLRQNGAKIPEDEILITKILRDRGYVCGLSGKLHLAPCQGRVEERIDDGYAEFHWSHGPWPKWKENQYIQWVNRQGEPWEELYSVSPELFGKLGAAAEDKEGRQAWAGIPVHLHQSYWCAEKAIEFMHKYRDAPWLFSVNPFDPHHPFDPPAEFLARYDPDRLPPPSYQEGELDDKPIYQSQACRKGASGGAHLSFEGTTDRQHRQIKAAYYAMIENVDYNVGRLIDALEDTGQIENTLILFTSDHGEMLGDHGIFLKGPYLYDPAVRVPLILSYPREFQRGVRSDALVELVDLAPTLLDLIGFPIPERMQGRSFLSICHGENDLHHHKDYVYSEFYNSSASYRDPYPYLTMVRDKKFKIVAYGGMELGELYDMENDPGEVINLWNDAGYRDVRFQYLKKCLDASVFTIDPLPERVGEY